MSKQLLRHCLSRPLPTLKQGSTLSIRSSVPATNLSIRSSWRDDGNLSMLQTLRKGGIETDVIISKEKDRSTSMGREESFISILLKPKDMTTPGESAAKGATNPQNNYQESVPPHPVEKNIILDDGTMFPDSEEWSPPPAGLRRIEYNDGIAHITKNEVDDQKQVTSLFLEVPEKANIEVDLINGGSISIHNKIEGDIRLFTKNGDVRVKKLRGHVIDIQAQGVGNTIYASDLLEAQSLNIDLPNPGRLRSKRIHANTCDIKIGIGGSSEQSDTAVNELIDADDSGSICDISSLYLTGEATICVQSPKNERPRQSVRVKSNHGHVTVDAISPKPELRNAMTGDALPIVDMGGVNGSCEVFVRGDKSNEEIEKDGWVSCHVHMDSISPDSVSIIKADVGNVHATFDRKVESDLRLLSASDAASVDVDTLLVDELEGDDFDDFKNMLRELDESSRPQDEKMIKIRTNAFTASNGSIDLGLENCELVEGWIENKTAEPDSRFDRKLRGDTGSIGKIRLEGAAFQALQGFQGAKTENDKDSFPRPLFAVFSTGEIVIETLSWLGNIARRYGLDDNRNKEDLGRTATRRGRSLDPTNE